MDFDDLDEELEARVAAGEEVAGYVRENNQPRQGEVLEVMERSWRLPDLRVLNDRDKKQVPPWNGADVVEKKPVVRLLLVHGVADSLNQGWHTMIAEAPPEIDVAMHEYPSHGHREDSDEEIPADLDTLVDDCYEAFKEAMDTGAFALLGHSIGCLIVVRVAARARKELGVEPVMVYMIERGAPPYGKWTEEGMRVLHDDKVAFMEANNPNIASLYGTGTPTGIRTMDLWQRGWFIENACLDVGFHVFECPIITMYAELMVGKVPKEHVAKFLENENSMKLTKWNAFYVKDEQGNLFIGHFPIWSFEEWDKWTKHPLKVLRCRDVDHSGIKTDVTFRNMVWETLQELIKDW